MNSRSELLTNIPTVLLPEKITSARLIKGGLNNRNILINEDWLIKEYLVRDESNDPVYLRFLREKETLRLFKGNNHVPNLLKYYDNAKNYFIARKWVEGQPFSIIHVQNHIKSLIDAIATIHRITDSTSGDFQYFDVIKRYLQEYKNILSYSSDSSSLNNLFATLPPYYKVDRFFYDEFSQIRESDYMVRIHGDLVLSNIFLTENKKNVVFIDWEYSTLGDPLIDLAYLLSQNQISHNVQQIIIEAYNSKLKIHVDRDELKLYYDLMILMSGLWYAIHAARLISSNRKPFHHASSKEFIKLALDQFRFLNLGNK